MTKEDALQIRRILEDAVQSLNNNDALLVKTLFARWMAGRAYAAGCKVHYDGNLWRAVQAHTAQAGWEPENAPALWEQVCESHSGAMDDPIPYDGNMALESGKCYIQDGEIYRCTRDTGNPLYNALSELVGLYVETI